MDLFRMNHDFKSSLVMGLCTLLFGCITSNGKNSSDLGTYHFSMGQYNRAVDYYQDALEEDPDNTEYLTLMGWTYFKLANYDQAISTFEKLEGMDPGAIDAYTGRGWSHFKKLNFDQAIIYFQQALAVDPDSTDAYDGLGWCSSKKDENEKAERYFNIALRKSMGYKKSGNAKTDPEAHRGLGYLNFSKGDYKMALKHLKIATLLMPEWNDARLKWGDCLFTLEKYKQAIGVYKNASRQERSASVYDKLGWCYVHLGDGSVSESAKTRNYDQAKKMFEESLAIDPIYTSALSGIAEIDTKMSSY